MGSKSKLDVGQPPLCYGEELKLPSQPDAAPRAFLRAVRIREVPRATHRGERIAMGGAKKAGKAKKASKAQRDAPYAWVTDCDGCGGFTLGGVIPLRSGFDVHVLMLRTGDGVRDGYHKGGQPTDVRDMQLHMSFRAVKFPLSAA